MNSLTLLLILTLAVLSFSQNVSQYDSIIGIWTVSASASSCVPQSLIISPSNISGYYLFNYSIPDDYSCEEDGYYSGFEANLAADYTGYNWNDDEYVQFTGDVLDGEGSYGVWYYPINNTFYFYDFGIAIWTVQISGVNIPSASAPAIQGQYALNSFVNPPYINTANCYPQLLTVINNTAYPYYYNGNWTFSYYFNWTWSSSGWNTPCASYSSGYVVNMSVPNNNSYYNSYSWFVPYGQIYGVFFNNNNSILANLPANYNYSNSNSSSVLLVQSKPPVPPAPAITGNWSLSEFINPPLYSPRGCYPETLSIQNSNINPFYNGYDWTYTFYLSWNFFASPTCQSQGLAYGWNLFANLTAQSNFAFNFGYNVSLYAQLQGGNGSTSYNSSLTVYQSGIYNNSWAQVEYQMVPLPSYYD